MNLSAVIEAAARAHDAVWEKLDSVVGDSSAVETEAIKAALIAGLREMERQEYAKVDYFTEDYPSYVTFQSAADNLESHK